MTDGNTKDETRRRYGSEGHEELAVGSDLEFQRRWWRFTRALWLFFAAVIVADLVGVFGRGPIANATARSPDGAMTVRYERIERYGAPSVLRIEFAPNAIHDGKVELWVGETLIKSLGAQRVIPQPAQSRVGAGGVTYLFPASDVPASVTFALEPTVPGILDMPLRASASGLLKLRAYVLP